MCLRCLVHEQFGTTIILLTLLALTGSPPASGCIKMESGSQAEYNRGPVSTTYYMYYVTVMFLYKKQCCGAGAAILGQLLSQSRFFWSVEAEFPGTSPIWPEPKSALGHWTSGAGATQKVVAPQQW